MTSKSQSRSGQAIMQISIELVARSLAQVRAEALEVRASIPSICLLNVPDLLRFPVRSWEACSSLKHDFTEVIPHIRAMDFDLAGGRLTSEIIEKLELTSVLVVQGDAPLDLQHRTHPTSSVQVIRYLRQHFPKLRIYAAIDQYRSSFRKELEYAAQKIEVGANGFFTQPFFDSRMLGIYAEALAQTTTVFWGISPVLSETSRSYWENKNNAKFPRGFSTDLDTNVTVAREILETARYHGGNAYIMPIRADALSYLRAIFSTRKPPTRRCSPWLPSQTGGS